MSELKELAVEALKDAVTSGTAGVGEATHGGAVPEEEDEAVSPEEEDEVAEKAARAASLVIKGWTGPHEGPQGGIFWENVETGERRYQEDRPGDESAPTAGEETGEFGQYETGDFDPGNEYEAATAEAVTEGWFGNTHTEDDYVAVRNVQHNISQIEDPDLLEAMWEQEKAGRNSRACVSAIESRMRAVGMDPPREVGEDVPDIRQGTALESFGREEAIEACSFVMWNFDSTWHNFEEWNQLLDRMTQDELEEALGRWFNQRYYVEDSPLNAAADSSDLMDWEDGHQYMDVAGEDHVEVREVSEDDVPGIRGTGALVSRMDHESVMSVVHSIEDEERQAILGKQASLFANEARTRRLLAKEFVVGDVSPFRTFGSHARMQFGDIYSDFQRDDFYIIQEETASAWTGMGVGMDIIRAMMAGEMENEDADVARYVGGFPIDSIEPSEEFLEAMERVREANREFWEDPVSAADSAGDSSAQVWADEALRSRNPDGTITVYRGTSERASTSHGPLESWSTDRSVAEDFGERVLEARIEPEDIFMSAHAAAVEGLQFVGYSEEHEVVLPGGVFDG